MGCIQFPKNRMPPQMRDDVGWSNIKNPSNGSCNGPGNGGAIKAINGYSYQKFVSPPMYGKAYSISGQTLDSTGAVLADCVVALFYTRNDVLVGETMSDSLGNYKFLVGPAYNCYIVAYKAGSPDVSGTTVNTLIAV
jgi:hypothetical protein